MAYQIIYDPDLKSKYPAKRNNKPVGQYIVAFVLFAAITVLLCHPPVRYVLKNFLLPGDPDITLSASQKLVETLKNGNTVRDSVMAFCMEILDGAQR